MLDIRLQKILLATTLLFLIYIIIMVKQKKLQLRYILVWFSTSVLLILVSLIPGLINVISDILHIKEPVNTLFLILIFFMLLIIFSLTKEVSKEAERIRRITQEMALLMHHIEELQKQISKEKE